MLKTVDEFPRPTYVNCEIYPLRSCGGESDSPCSYKFGQTGPLLSVVGDNFVDQSSYQQALAKAQTQDRFLMLGPYPKFGVKCPSNLDTLSSISGRQLCCELGSVNFI